MDNSKIKQKIKENYFGNFCSWYCPELHDLELLNLLCNRKDCEKLISEVCDGLILNDFFNTEAIKTIRHFEKKWICKLSDECSLNYIKGTQEKVILSL